MFGLPDPASNVASDVVFTCKKEWCFWLMIVLPNHSHRTIWHVCVSIVPIVLHIFHVFAVGQRRGVLRVTMFFPKGVQLHDGWMALEL